VPSSASDDLEAALQGAGFQREATDERGLDAYTPWSFPQPLRVVSRHSRQCDGADVDVFHYEYRLHTKNGPRVFSKVVALARHPGIEGGAAIAPDLKRWGTGYALVHWVVGTIVIVAISPVLLLGLVVWLIGKAFGRSWISWPRRTIDRLTGHRHFDRLYTVAAESDAAASRAITTALRDYLTRARFRGALELRRGLLLCDVSQASFDQSTQSDRLAAALHILGAAVRKPAHPMR